MKLKLTIEPESKNKLMKAKNFIQSEMKTVLNEPKKLDNLQTKTAIFKLKNIQATKKTVLSHLFQKNKK